MTAQTFSDIPPRAISQRDRALLAWLAAVKIASEHQLIRRYWAATTASPARRRLRQLTEQYRLLRPVSVDRVKMATAGLELGPVYELTPLGRDWLKKTSGGEPGYQSKPAQYLHDLLVAEISVRLAEIAIRRGPGCTSDWFGEADIRPFAPKGLLPDGMGLLRRPDGSTEFAFFLELDASRESHGRPSSQIGRKVGDYDRYAETWVRRPGPAPLTHFPAVLFITHGAERLANLAADIRKHRRRQPVAYGLARLDDLLAAPNLLTAPAWRLLPADGRQADLLNQPLLNDGPWLLPPPKRSWPTSTSAEPADPPPSEPRPSPTPTPKPAPAMPARPAAVTPPRTAATPPRTAAMPPRTAATPKPSPAPPPPPVTPEPARPWLQSDGLFWLLALIILMLGLITPARPLHDLRDWLNATPTPTPTATPRPFAHVPTATPYGRGYHLPYPVYPPPRLLSTPPTSR